MIMKKITEEMNIHEEWFKQAKQVTLKTLPKFINHLLNDYKHDYGTIVHALSAGALATVYAMNKHKQGGITRFQASFVMWDFIRNWMYTTNKTSLKIIDYDKMLFPQYEDYFDKKINSDTWKSIQKEAQKRLNEIYDYPIHQDVIKHWKSIVKGNVPFGYKVIEN